MRELNKSAHILYFYRYFFCNSNNSTTIIITIVILYLRMVLGYGAMPHVRSPGAKCAYFFTVSSVFQPHSPFRTNKGDDWMCQLAHSWRRSWNRRVFTPTISNASVPSEWLALPNSGVQSARSMTLNFPDPPRRRRAPNRYGWFFVGPSFHAGRNELAGHP